MSKPERDISTDLRLAKEVLAELERSKESEITYGSLAFWIMVVKKCEKLSDDISMKDFYKVLTNAPGRFATVRVTDEVGG